MTSGLDLEPGLVAESVQYLRADARNAVAPALCEFTHGRDSEGALDLLGLLASEPCHERHVIVGNPLLVAGIAPETQFAVRDPPRVGVDSRSACCFEPCLCCTEVGGEVGLAQGVLDPTPDDDMNLLRRAALESLQLRGILAELEHG
jgi:hypothetical protein